ncbi:MAG: YHS domain-containing protein [Thiohalomonadales bacterium]
MTNKNTVRDYVCLMDVEPGTFAYDFLGKSFSFCSRQCRDRFESNPHLYIGHAGQAAPKQRGEKILKRRVLKFDHIIPEKDGIDIIKTLKLMMGIKDVTITNNLISITYDLLEVTSEQMENAIENSGKTLGVSWSGKLKRAFVHYHEETELDNLEYDNTAQGQHHH